MEHCRSDDRQYIIQSQLNLWMDCLISAILHIRPINVPGTFRSFLERLETQNPVRYAEWQEKYNFEPLVELKENPARNPLLTQACDTCIALLQPRLPLHKKNTVPNIGHPEHSCGSGQPPTPPLGSFACIALCEVSLFRALVSPSFYVLHQFVPENPLHCLFSSCCSSLRFLCFPSIADSGCAGGCPFAAYLLSLTEIKVLTVSNGVMFYFAGGRPSPNYHLLLDETGHFGPNL